MTRTTATTTTTTSTTGFLEHINLTVSDPERTAAMLVDLFDWHVRWKGDSIHDGRTIHVGTDTDYLALYTMPTATSVDVVSYGQVAGLNHIAIVVDDLDALEQRVINAGFEPTNHADYEPGRRFYFRDHDNVEFEVVSYS
jgi:catechol 2,3-dioxygenase-like lactoylglutathione lyase family enzyme